MGKAPSKKIETAILKVGKSSAFIHPPDSDILVSYIEGNIVEPAYSIEFKRFSLCVEVVGIHIIVFQIKVGSNNLSVLDKGYFGNRISTSLIGEDLAIETDKSILASCDLAP